MKGVGSRWDHAVSMHVKDACVSEHTVYLGWFSKHLVQTDKLQTGQ